jgi:hypothetical protein
MMSTSSSRRQSVTRGFSDEASARDAIASVREQIWQEKLELVVLFISPDYDIAEVERAIAIEFADTRVIGCTSAGEINGLGYGEGTITGVGFPASHFKAQVKLIEDLKSFSIADGERIVKQALESFGHSLPSARFVPSQTFAMLLVDGLSKQEEALISTINRFLDPVPLFGGSAGDGLNFGKTFVFANGRFHENAAVLTVIHTSCPFKVFKLDHFHPTDRKMVVTEADPNQRLVHEINAEPAAPAYARMVGLEAQELSPLIFASYPVVVKIGGEYHVRAIQKVEPDGSLRFYCGIDEGLVLTVAHGEDMALNLGKNLEELSRQIGTVDVILGFDCILRRLEAEQKQQVREVSSVLKRFNVFGFNTYGEQFRSMHVNQTFTGVIIGAPPDLPQAAE